MCRFNIASIILPAALLISCSTPTHRDPPEILHAVSTDAVMVCSADRLDDVLNMAFDSTDAVRSFNWGKLAGRQAAASFVFNRHLSPVLCIDAGRASEDTLETVRALMRQAAGTGFQVMYYPGTSIGRRCNLLLVTRSEAVSSDVQRHIESGRSIMDLEDFVKAFGMADGTSVQIVRNSALEQILPKNYLSVCFKRSDLLKFVCNASDWIVISPTDDGNLNISTCRSTDESQYANVLPKLKCAESQLSQIMPENTQMALSLPIGDGFRETYEDWRYACSNLNKYEKTLAAVKKNTTVDPLKWEKQAGVREIGLIQWGEESKVLAIRADRLPDVQGCEVNELKGITAALYGSAFGTVADSCCTRRGGWLVCGSEPDIKAFPDGGTQAISGWPQKPCKFAFSYGGQTMSADDKGIIVNR